MNGFDFLSEASKNNLFGRSSNKTNLGGVFTLIYLLIVITIIITYLYEYIVTPKYSYLYSYEHQYKADKESLINRYNNKDLNPDITFNMRIAGKDTNNSNFAVSYARLSFDGEIIDNHTIEFGKDYTKKLYDLYFILYYKCDKNGGYVKEGR